MNGFDIVKSLSLDPILFASTMNFILFIADFILIFLFLRLIFKRIRIFVRHRKIATWLAFLFALAALPLQFFAILVAFGIFGTIVLTIALILLWVKGRRRL